MPKSKMVNCPDCNGSGGDNTVDIEVYVECPTCTGTGEVVEGTKSWMHNLFETKDVSGTIVTHVKRINGFSGVVKIMTIGDVVEEVGTDAIDHLQNWGKLLFEENIYHVIDTQDALMEILGKSVVFRMKDGQTYMIKVQGIGFMGVIQGFDDERMNMTINLDQVDEYYLPGVKP